ncbi:MAG: aminodeoxychorismate synthase component I [Xanthomonadaceae bacterium]|nr:aminodeoxychorismate synthase component I [Xanthomonadaceae bacterium]
MSDFQRTLPGVRDLLPLAAADPWRYPCLLESAASGAHSRHDILFAFPQDALTLHADGRVRDMAGRDRGADFLAGLDAAFGAERTMAPADSPFSGGWALFLGYELATQVEPGLHLPPAPDARIPVALALRCPAAIVVDRIAQTTRLIAEPGHANLLGDLARDLESTPQFMPAPIPGLAVEEDDPRYFLDGVARIQEYLRRGDTYQVNLSREWRLRNANPLAAADLHISLRRNNPAPFSGLLQWLDSRRNAWAIVSSSPERLIEVRHGIAQTRPIAGTRARMAGEDDAARVRELIGHPKERAEHVMLIDLERNDLGRVCVAGSVEVDELMTVESYAHVHHIVSNVRGRVRVGATPGEVIRAVFPGGTVTGCPKVRCMQIIAELEAVGRGAYTGALGYLDCNGNMDLNILIRTLTLRDGLVRLRAGAGIVADSVAEHELAETRAKARGLLCALGVAG